MNNKLPIDSGSIELERYGSVAQIMLSRPEFHNALTWEMYKELKECLDMLKDDDSVRVLVIRGAEHKAFAAGTDIKQFKGFNGKDGLEYEREIDDVVKKLEEFPKPTIAAIKGYAVGGGMIIAAACDLRYSIEKCKFGAPMSKTLGNCLSLENYARISKEIGVMKTKELLYTGCLISSKEAEKLGFITKIFEEQDFFENVISLAKEISENAFSTVKATKIAFNRLNEKDNINNPIDFDDVIYKVYNSEYFAEGVMAHMEKRRPIWEK